MDMVLGFMFATKPVPRVALIQKNHPEFMAGKWNGIGGRIECAELSQQAMCREFKEETGVQTFRTDWTRAVAMNVAHHTIDIFKGDGDRAVEKYPGDKPDKLLIDCVETTTDEKVQVWPVQCLPRPYMDNLDWMLPLLTSRLEFPIQLHELCSEEARERKDW